MMDGVAIIVLGFVAFGVAHIKSTSFEPWQWLNVVFGLITLVASVLFWCAVYSYHILLLVDLDYRFLFPDNPTTAWFLTPSERVVAVARVRANQTGIENKHFKKAQYVDILIVPYNSVRSPERIYRAMCPL